MKRFILIAGSLFSVCSFAYDGSVDITSCPTTVLTVSNVENASGWGAHFSTHPYSDGYGGTKAECHLSGPNSGPGIGLVTVLCYDGYINSSAHVDSYRLDLGPRNLIRQVEFKVTNRGVAVDVVAHSISSYTSDENDYVKSAFFPMREASGFCRENTLYYEVDGVLSQTLSRDGSGYTLSVGTIN